MDRIITDINTRIAQELSAYDKPIMIGGLTEPVIVRDEAEQSWPAIIDDTGESVGFIWTLQEEFQGKKQSFLCDLAIWESQRRKGYATAALQMAETAAAKAGCCESVLFVRDTNVAARALYEKSGTSRVRYRRAFCRRSLESMRRLVLRSA